MILTYDVLSVFWQLMAKKGINYQKKSDRNRLDAITKIYKENKDLEKGEIEKIDYEADRLDVVVNRTVSRNGDTLYQDTIKTHYLPWRAIYEFGPGTELPDDVDVEKADD